MVNSRGTKRRRLSIEDRRDEVLQACLRIIGTRPWDEVSMADIAAEAGASKPLLYHYFSNKSDLYLAAVHSAAVELREVTRPDPALAFNQRLVKALEAHVDWIDAHALAYRAILQGGISSAPGVHAIVEESRAEVVERLTEGFGLHALTPAQRIAIRGWIGFLESACIDWLAAKDLTKPQLVSLLARSVVTTFRAAADPATSLPPGNLPIGDVDDEYGSRHN